MSRSRKRRLLNQINVIPYIDVTLVLLVIFMVTTPLINLGVVDLPSVGQSLRQIKQGPIVLTIASDGQISLEQKQLSRSALVPALRQLLKDDHQRPVVIAADKTTQYVEIIAVMDLLKRAHIDKVGLLLQPFKAK